MDVDNGKQAAKLIEFGHQLDKIMGTDPKLIENLGFGVYKRIPLQ